MEPTGSGWSSRHLVHSQNIGTDPMDQFRILLMRIMMQWCCFQPVMITSNNRSGFCVLSLMDLINHGVTSSITPFKVDSCQCWTISIKLLGAGGWLRQLIKISPRLINSIAAVRCVCYVTADFISLLVRWISFFFMIGAVDGCFSQLLRWFYGNDDWVQPWLPLYGPFAAEWGSQKRTGDVNADPPSLTRYPLTSTGTIFLFPQVNSSDDWSVIFMFWLAPDSDGVENTVRISLVIRLQHFDTRFRPFLAIQLHKCKINARK